MIIQLANDVEKGRDILKLILHYLRRYKKLFIISVISVFEFALVGLNIPTIIADMINVGVTNAGTDCIIRMGFVVLLISPIGVSMTIFLGYCYAKTSTAITRDIRNDIFDHAQRFTVCKFNRFGISSMITRTNNDAFQIQMFVDVLLCTTLMTPIMFAASIIMTAKASLPLNGIIVATIPLIITGVFVVAKISKSIPKNQQTSLDSLNRISCENLSGIRVVRAFDSDTYEQQRFGGTNEKFTGHSKKLLRLTMMTSPVFFLLVDVAGLCIYWVAALLIQGGGLPLGQLMTFMDYLSHAMFSIMLFCTVFVMYPRVEVSAKHIEAVFGMVLLMHNDRKHMDGNQQETISFEHVAFVYPDGEEPVLEDVSFSTKKGETIALIGSTGSEKSTLVNLIPRLYDTSEGSIRIDGVDIRDYDLFGLRSRLGVIPQKTFLFNGAIADNIRFGKPDAAMEGVMQTAKTAQAYDFIMEKEHDFEEEVTEGAASVSSGQKQRLSIARALIRKPDIYVFDNSFSALDFRTGVTLRKELKRETGDTIVMVIAQRTFNIMEANRVVVLNEGSVIGIRTHRELLKNCEIYKEIALSQLSKEGLAREQEASITQTDHIRTETIHLSM